MFEQIAEFEPPSGLVTCVRFSPDSKSVACALSNGFVTVRDTDLKEIVTKQLHQRSVNEVRWSSDGSLLLTCSDDGTLLLSRASDLRRVCECRGHHSYVVACDIAPNSLRIASGSYDESVRIWESASGKCLKMISAHSEPVTSVCFSNGGTFVMSSSWDGYCRVWLAHSGICVKAFAVFGLPITFSTLSPNNEFVLAAGTNSTLKLVHTREEKPATVYRGHVNEKFCLFGGFTKNEEGEQELFVASEDGTIVGWNVNSQRVAWTVEVCSGPTLCGDVCRNGNLLVTGASADNDRKIRIFSRWTYVDPEEQRRMQQEEEQRLQEEEEQRRREEEERMRQEEEERLRTEEEERRRQEEEERTRREEEERRRQEEEERRRQEEERIRQKEAERRKREEEENRKLKEEMERREREMEEQRRAEEERICSRPIELLPPLVPPSDKQGTPVRPKLEPAKSLQDIPVGSGQSSWDSHIRGTETDHRTPASGLNGSLSSILVTNHQPEAAANQKEETTAKKPSPFSIDQLLH